VSVMEGWSEVTYTLEPADGESIESVDRLSEMGRQIMDALIDLDASDPFVSADGTKGTIVISVVVPGESTESITTAGQLVTQALRTAGFTAHVDSSAESHRLAAVG
jgi:hypothetical protein